MAKTKQILTAPAPDTKIKPIYTYTQEQQVDIDALRTYTNDILLPPTDPYHPHEKQWLERADTIPRYMRAAKWKLEDGKKRIKGTLEWRREYKPDLIRPDEVRIESETGKILLNGFDIDGRPILYMRPGNENTPHSPRQVRHLVWWLERARDFMPPGQESLVIIVDYKSTTLRTNPSISVASKVLTILQNHYPEHLGRALVVNLPYLLNFFYKGISPFLDPVTRDKMRFNPHLPSLIPPSHLDASFPGGEYEFEFEHEAYWKQIIEFCRIGEDGVKIDSGEEGESASPPDSNGPSTPTEVPTVAVKPKASVESLPAIADILVAA